MSPSENKVIIIIIIIILLYLFWLMDVQFGDLVVLVAYKKYILIFFKCVLTVKRSTPRAMLYGDLGRFFKDKR